jgi:hypothetical protein
MNNEEFLRVKVKQFLYENNLLITKEYNPEYCDYEYFISSFINEASINIKDLTNG